MTKSQKLVNEQYFNKVLKMLNDNGVWIWPDENEAYKKITDKFQPITPYGYQCLKKITTKEWFQENVLEP